MVKDNGDLIVPLNNPDTNTYFQLSPSGQETAYRFANGGGSSETGNFGHCDYPVDNLYYAASAQRGWIQELDYDFVPDGYSTVPAINWSRDFRTGPSGTTTNEHYMTYHARYETALKSMIFEQWGSPQYKNMYLLHYNVDTLNTGFFGSSPDVSIVNNTTLAYEYSGSPYSVFNTTEGTGTNVSPTAFTDDTSNIDVTTKNTGTKYDL